jgi:hypothetical protein
MIMKLRNQPYAPKWEQEEKKMEENFPDKLVVAQLIKELTSLYDSQRLITVFTKVRHLSLREAKYIPPTFSTTTSLKSILILFSYLSMRYF